MALPSKIENRPADRFAHRRAQARNAAERPELAPVEFVEPPRKAEKPRGGRAQQEEAQQEEAQQEEAQQADHSPEAMRLLRNPFAA